MTANYILIDRIELNASAASVTFSNIPQTGYTDLKIVVSGRTNRALEVDGLNISFNTGGTYSGRRLYGTGSGAGSDTTYAGMPFMTAANATANTFGNAEFYIPNYTGSNAKSFSIDGVGETNATTTYMGLGAGLWSGTSAITSITITPETGTAILAGSTFSLYGLAALGTTPAVAPKADGGNVIATDGTYWYHAFLSSGTFTPQTNLSADVLVVAGGGGGGQYFGGGGGAGGLLAFTSQSLTATSYTCTVGAGGAAGVGTGTRAGNGNDSQFGALTLVKGGGSGGVGGGTIPPAGFASNTGGSGGGGASSTAYLAGAAGTSGQGNSGGSVPAQGGNYPSAGGGGATAAGVSPASNTSAGGNGGAGSNAYSSWATATATGVSGYYAGGGGGSGGTNTSIGSGGAGGGGNGNYGNGSGVATTSPGNGVANTGGGGGGGNQAGQDSTGTGSTGGSGLVIIRYLVA